MQPHFIKVTKTARYFYSGSVEEGFDTVCFALHGYGQLASYFSRHFQSLEKVLFIVPEGLHRFYLKESAGRVGASWMSREERLSDIEDYVAYLNQLYDAHAGDWAADVRIGVLGFSQGVATACRWFAESGRDLHYLINWAGAFPPDLNFEQAIARMKHIPLYLVKGTEDEFISEKLFTEHVQLLRDKGFNPLVKSYAGGHRLHAETLQALFREIRAAAD